MRPIDADTLKDKVLKWMPSDPCGIAEKEHPIETDIVVSLLLEIDEAPTIEQPTWIPCSERLPARQGYYICTCKDGSRVLKTTTIKWSNGWQLSGTRAYWKVVAWMPLPKPWKGADDE